MTVSFIILFRIFFSFLIGRLNAWILITHSSLSTFIISGSSTPSYSFFNKLFQKIIVSILIDIPKENLIPIDFLHFDGSIFDS